MFKGTVHRDGSTSSDRSLLKGYAWGFLAKVICAPSCESPLKFASGPCSFISNYESNCQLRTNYGSEYWLGILLLIKHCSNIGKSSSRSWQLIPNTVCSLRLCQSLHDIKQNPQLELCALCIANCVPNCQSMNEYGVGKLLRTLTGREQEKFAENLCASPFHKTFRKRQLLFQKLDRQAPWSTFERIAKACVLINMCSWFESLHTFLKTSQQILS